MYEIRNVALILIVGVAVLDDLNRGKISNGIILTGLLWGVMYQIFQRGIIGSLLFLGGVLLPLVLMSGLYYFRMIGAGDIKLLSVIGGFLGPAGIFFCMLQSLFWGGLVSLGYMIFHRNFYDRFLFLMEYVSTYSQKKKWSSYMEQVGEDARFSFSIPVFLGVFLQICGGGIF